MPQISWVATGTHAVPGDWNNTGSSIELVGAGSNGQARSSTTKGGIGGGGGAYLKQSNVTLTAGNYTVTVPGGNAGTACTFVKTGDANLSVNSATATSLTGGTAGAGNTLNYAGGNGIAPGTNQTSGGGGGGAGGPHGAGSTPVTATYNYGGNADGGTVIAPTTTPAIGNVGTEWASATPAAGCGTGASGGTGAAFAGKTAGGGGSGHGAGASGTLTTGSGTGLVVLTYVSSNVSQTESMSAVDASNVSYGVYGVSGTDTPAIVATQNWVAVTYDVAVSESLHAVETGTTPEHTLSLIVDPANPEIPFNLAPGQVVTTLTGHWNDDTGFGGNFTFAAPNWDGDGVYAITQPAPGAVGYLIISTTGPGVGGAGGSIEDVTIVANETPVYNHHWSADIVTASDSSVGVVTSAGVIEEFIVETATAADIASGAASFPVAQNETATVAEKLNLIFYDSVIEVGRLADAPTAAGVFLVSAPDVSTVTDVVPASGIFVTVDIENEALIQSAQNGLVAHTFEVSVAEVPVVADTLDARFVFAETTVETTTAVDSPDGSVLSVGGTLYPVDVAETATPSDLPSENQNYWSIIAEIGTAGDVPGVSSSVYGVVRAENPTSTATQTERAIFAVSVATTTTAQETSNYGNVIYDGVAEVAIAADTADGPALFAGRAADTLTISATPADLWIFNKALSDTGLIFDTPSKVFISAQSASDAVTIVATQDWRGAEVVHEIAAAQDLSSATYTLTVQERLFPFDISLLTGPGEEVKYLGTVAVIERLKVMVAPQPLVAPHAVSASEATDHITYVLPDFAIAASSQSESVDSFVTTYPDRPSHSSVATADRARRTISTREIG